MRQCRSGTSPLRHRPAAGKRRRPPGRACTRATMSGSADRICLLRESLGVSRITSSACTVKWFSTKEPGTKADKGHSKGSSQGSPRTVRSKPRSARANQELVNTSSADDARPTHLGALIADKTWILDMFPGARLDTLTEAASAAFPNAFDDSENPTAQLYLQKAAHAQQMKLGSTLCKGTTAHRHLCNLCNFCVTVVTFNDFL